MNCKILVTFYGNDTSKGSREIKEQNTVFNDELEFENKLSFNNASNFKINF